MGYDPAGTFNWGTFAKGVSIALVGLTAIATVATAGCAAPLLASTIAIASGVACVGFGASEMYEAATDYNIIRDKAMGGNQELYDTVRTAAEFTATISTIAVSIGTAMNKAANPLSQCFVAGTLILTATGLVEIEKIECGDLVWATDPETGATELKKVVQLFRNETNEWVHLTVNEEEITCTPEHPFYSPVKGWTAAINLRAGDILVTVNGEYAVLEEIQHEILEAPETTYNFEVEDFHTYYVSSTGVLVHNKCTQNTIGSYLIKDMDDNVIYVGKGSINRMHISMKLRGGSSCVFYPAETNEMALANEAYFMSIYGGAQSVNIGSGLLNAINSPGLKYLFMWY